VGKWKMLRERDERTMEDSEEETVGRRERVARVRGTSAAHRLRASIARLLDGRWRVGGEGRYLRERRLGRNIV
jgi:hypothetical protein